MRILTTLTLFLITLTLSILLIAHIPARYEFNQFLRSSAYHPDSSSLLYDVTCYFKDTTYLLSLPTITQPEALHMYEVKQILWIIKLIFVALFAPLLLAVFKLPLAWRHNASSKALKISLRFYGILWIWSLISFSALFKAMHHLIFTTQRQFPRSSILIQLFPPQFFITSLVGIAVLNIILLLLTKILLGRIRKTKNT